MSSRNPDAKNRQAAYSEKQYADAEAFARADPFHDHFRAIPFQRLVALLDRCSVSVQGKRWLVAGCGSGTDLSYLTRTFDADWTATDISPTALRLTQTSFPDVRVLTADLEHLPFREGEFDVAFVAATLHHLPRPMLGLYELLRVAGEAVIVIEPNDGWLTRLATKVGIAREFERAGNYVYRLGAGDVKRVASAGFYRAHVDRFFATHKVARSPLEFRALKALNGTANAVAPRLGNYIVAVIEK